MATFTISEDNNITVFATAKEAAQAGDATATTFDSQAGLAKVSADWPLSRFVEIYNSIAGNGELKKFADRKKAVARIWSAIQPIAARVTTSPAEEPKPAKSPKAPKRTKKAKSTKKSAAAKKATHATKSADKGERSNKKAEVITMMRRAKGVTLAEIMEETGWQAHTVRGFVSILGSKGGEKIESSKNATGDRTYKIAK